MPARRGRPSASAWTLTDAALFDAALDTFAARGFDATSVRKLARDLGVSHNLIPQRHGTKEQLWLAAIDHGFAVLAADLVSVLAESEETDDVARLRALVVRFIEANAARPALLRIITQEALTPGPRLDHLFERYINPVRELGSAMLGKLQATGRVRSNSAPLFYFLMTHGAGGPVALPGLADRLGQPLDLTNPKAVHRHAVEVVDVIFDGLLEP